MTLPDPDKKAAEALLTEVRERLEATPKTTPVPEIPDVVWVWAASRAREPITWIGVAGYVLGLLHLNTDNDTITQVASVLAFVSSTLLIVLRQRFKG